VATSGTSASLRRLAGKVRRRLTTPATTASRGTAAPAQQAPAGRKKAIDKAYPRESTRNLYDAVDYLRTVEVGRAQERLVDRIRGEVAAGRALRIAFVVNDRSKWNASSLVEQLRTEGWEPRIHLCLTDAKGLSADEKRASYLEERAFFAAIDEDLVDLYDVDTGQEVPIEVVETDLVFYQQPWGMKDWPRRMVGRALGAYMHYGFMIMANHGMHYNVGTFHSYLWRYFAQTEEHRLLHLAHDPSAHDRIVVTGYPKLDVFLEPDAAARERAAGTWAGPDPRAKRIIFAPHHSLGKDNLQMSTFRWSGRRLLELARTEPGLQWVYKPHPTLKHSVVKNRVMTRAEYHDYERAWATLPNATVYDSGGYFDIFRASDAMITDCGSFLAEYLPTGKPLIWLVSEHSIGLNRIGQTLEPALYRADDLASFERLFDRVIRSGDDPLEEVRKARSALLFPGEGSSATAVVEHLRSVFAAPAAGPAPAP
jgi:hypothetical protein